MWRRRVYDKSHPSPDPTLSLTLIEGNAEFGRRPGWPPLERVTGDGVEGDAIKGLREDVIT